MGEALLDTNAWVAILRDEPAAPGIRDAIRDDRVVASPVALAELASLEARAGQPAKAVALVLGLARLEPLTPDDAQAGGALHGRLRKAGHAKVSLADALMYASARRVGARFVTMDGDLVKQPGVRFVPR